MSKYIAILSALFLVLFLGCDDSTNKLNHNDEYQEFVEHAEEHFIDGPFDTVTTVSDSTAISGDISEEHTCFYVVAADTEGWLIYTVEDEPGETEYDRTLFFDTPNITAELFDGRTEIHGHTADLDEVTTTVIEEGVIFHDLEIKTYHLKLENLIVGDTIRLVMAHGGDAHEE